VQRAAPGVKRNLMPYIVGAGATVAAVLLFRGLLK
jgi:hypothetical protein